MADQQRVESKESKLLRENWVHIHPLISGSIPSLCPKAISTNLLTKVELEKCTHQSLTDSEKANEFIRYISNKVSDDSTKLEVFINKVLGQDGTFTTLARRLLAELKKLKEQEEVLPVPVQETGCSETGGEDSSTCFSPSMSINALSSWLKSQGVSDKDLERLKEQKVSGRCFMLLGDDNMKEMSITFGGRVTISGLQAEEGVDGSTNLLTSSEAILDIKHLKHLVNETWDARTKWKFIGRQLDIDESTLTSIDGYKRGKAEDCYPEMLSIWLHRDGGTWSSLLNVFASPTVSLPDVIKHVNCLPDTKKKKIGLL